MFKSHIDFNDALSCYDFLQEKYKSDQEKSRLLKSNFLMYARLRYETYKDEEANKWVRVQENLDALFSAKKEETSAAQDDPLSEFLTDTYPIIDEEQRLDEYISELNAFIGVHKVKQKINEIIAYEKILTLRTKKGLSSPQISRHMAFLGNAGTGKTTIARQISKIFQALKICNSSFVEVDRSDLVGEYIGQTEVKTKDAFDKARGGILFVDEAQALLKMESGRDFGHECADVMAKLMEDRRNDTIVILAGHKKETQSTILSHKSIKSRISIMIDFDDFSVEETMLIFKKLCFDQSYKPDKQTLEKLTQYLKSTNPDGLGYAINARDIRNIFERSLVKQALRLSKHTKPTKKMLQDIQTLDLDLPDHSKKDKIVYL